MDNFTPLKPVEKKKKRINKFLIFGNLFLVILVALIGIFYYNQTLQPTQKKAYTIGDCKTSGYLSGRCIEYSQSMTGYRYFCPDGVGVPNGSCNGNDTPVSGTRICFQHECGVEQIDLSDGPPGCSWATRSDDPCEGEEEPPTQQTCPNGQPPVCGTPAITECVRPNECVIPEKILVGQGFCSTDPPKIVCQTNCTCETPTNTPTPTPPTATNTPRPTRTPTPTQPIMSVCNETCSSSDLCFNEEPGPNELVCTAVGGGVSRCRNKACVTSPTCVCPTSTPTPTPTEVITNTPTPTPTGTLTPTPTGTLTPTPTNTPGPSATPTPTDVPGEPTATPTEIVLAQTTVTSPPSVPVTGMIQSFMYLIPALIIFVGLIL